MLMNPLMGLEKPKKRRRRRRKSRLSEIGKPGDIVLGRTNDGRSWSAEIGKNGRLVKKVFEDW